MWLFFSASIEMFSSPAPPFVNITIYFGWNLNVKRTFHSWDKAHLVMVYYHLKKYFTRSNLLLLLRMFLFKFRGVLAYSFLVMSLSSFGFRVINLKKNWRTFSLFYFLKTFVLKWYFFFKFWCHSPGLRTFCVVGLLIVKIIQ